MEAGRTKVRSDGACSIRVIRPVGRYLASLGADVDRALRLRGVAPEQLADRDAYIAHDALAEMVDAAVALTGDRALGMHAVEHVEPGDFDVLEYAAASCATLGDSMRCAARYLALLHAGLDVQLVVDRDYASLQCAFAPGLAPVPVATEYLLAALVSFGRRFTGLNLRPLAVDFSHAAPADTAPFARTFRAPVRFGAGVDAIWFPARALDLSQARADSGLHSVLVRHADELLRSVPREQRFELRVREHITAELCGGNPSAEHVAERLGVSMRTLHRRLRAEGKTFRDIADDLRCSLAIRHLEHSVFSIGEISFLLGFAHATAFHKAFRRWTGQTPAHYRELAARRRGACG